MSASAAHRWAAASAHLSAIIVAAAVAFTLAGPLLVAVIAAPVGPIAVALLSRRAGLFVRNHSREAVRFCLSVAFVVTGVVLAMLASLRVDAFEDARPLLVFAGLLITLNWLSFSVLAAARALAGREWRYPFVIGRRWR